MVLDTSALVAILFAEPEAAAFEQRIVADPVRLLSAASLVELSIVIEARLGDAGVREMELLLYKAAVEIAPVTREHADVARYAYRRFGKGRHPACLNFGDCFSYALMKVSGEPLLFKGDDFSRTDALPAVDTGKDAQR